MKTLTLNLKRKYFDEILAGTKTHEYRDIFPENEKKFVYYQIGDKTIILPDFNTGAKVKKQ